MRRLLALLLPVLLVACADGTRSVKAPPGEPPVRYGVIESATRIDLPVERGRSGGFFGSVLGNIGGAVLGRTGRGAAAGSILGGVAGGTAGDAAQNGDVQPGQELWVRVEGKPEPLVISQPVSKGQEFEVGERVRVIRGKRGQEQVEHEPPKAEPTSGKAAP